MRNDLQDFSNHPPQKPKPEPKAKRWEVSLYKLNPVRQANRSISALREFWERPFIVVGAKFAPEPMRNLLQRYETGNCSRKVKEHIFYHHQGAIDPIQDSDFKRLCKVLINKPYQDFYLITIPKGAYEDDFMGWIDRKMAL